MIFIMYYILVWCKNLSVWFEKVFVGLANRYQENKTKITYNWLKSHIITLVDLHFDSWGVVGIEPPHSSRAGPACPSPCSSCSRGSFSLPDGPTAATWSRRGRGPRTSRSDIGGAGCRSGLCKTMRLFLLKTGLQQSRQLVLSKGPFTMAVVTDG